jgi:transcriptional regulator
MYVPAHAREDRRDALHDAINAIRFGALVTVADGRPVVSHIPMLVEAREGGDIIAGHVAKANTQWRIGSSPAIASFAGPHFYVSPAVYETKRTSGKVVPTWNYIIVEAQGEVEFFEDPQRLLGIVTRLTDAMEASRPDRWRVSDAPADYIENQLRGIVGFELRVTSLTGSWKLSRNRSDADRAGVAELANSDENPAVRALAPKIRA